MIEAKWIKQMNENKKKNLNGVLHSSSLLIIMFKKCNLSSSYSCYCMYEYTYRKYELECFFPYLQKEKFYRK